MLSDADKDQLIGLIAKLTKSQAIQQLLAEVIERPTMSTGSARLAMAAMAASGLKELPAGWLPPLQAAIASNSELAERRVGHPARRSTAESGRRTDGRFIAQARRLCAPADVRLAALALVPGGVKSVSGNQLDLLLAAIDREQPSNLAAQRLTCFPKPSFHQHSFAEWPTRCPRPIRWSWIGCCRPLRSQPMKPLGNG